ncbi:TPA: hypothetical protein JD365_00670 [Citrobacter amalonaticus]|nr:hypothetical protein [Citrobacter amalonaticus]
MPQRVIAKKLHILYTPDTSIQSTRTALNEIRQLYSDIAIDLTLAEVLDRCELTPHKNGYRVECMVPDIDEIIKGDRIYADYH